MVVGFILLIVYFLANIRRATEVIVRRDTKFGTNAIASIIVVLGILVLVNFVFSKRNYRVDFTEGKMFSISSQTIQVLEGLDKEVKVTAFFEHGVSRDAEDLFVEYMNHSDKVTFETVDPVKNPSIATKYNITEFNSVIIECGEKIERISVPYEQDLTNAILKASREERKVIYFSEGHGERDIDNSTDAAGYGFVKEALEGLNYEVNKIFIAREGSIPEDCAALVIPGSSKEFVIIDKAGKKLTREPQSISSSNATYIIGVRAMP